MPDRDFDPIHIDIPNALESRFAEFSFWTTNSPEEPDGSIPVRGRVRFGLRRQKSADGNRTYIIGIKATFLQVQTAGCRFDENTALNDRVQEGAFKDRANWENEKSAEAGFDAEGNSRGGKAGAKAKASAKGKKHSSGDRQFEHYRVQWEAGGCSFGHPVHGDYFNEDGVFRGTFLSEADWGRLVPNRGEKHYEARFQLLVHKVGLSVHQEEPGVKDRIFHAQEGKDAVAFDALKAAVAGWVVEEALSLGRCEDGFDPAREELVLAQGEVSVDLRLMSVEPTRHELLLLPRETKTALPAPTEGAKSSKTPRKAAATRDE